MWCCCHQGWAINYMVTGSLPGAEVSCCLPGSSREGRWYILYKANLWLIVFYLLHPKFIVPPNQGKCRWSVWSFELEKGQRTSGTYWQFGIFTGLHPLYLKIEKYCCTCIYGCLTHWRDVPAESLTQRGQCTAPEMLLHPGHVASFLKGSSL